MSSSDRINENGHLSAPVPKPREPKPGTTSPTDLTNMNAAELPYAYELLHELVDLVLEGDTESALRVSAQLAPDELKFYHEKLEVLRQALAARLVVNMLKSMPDVTALLKSLGLALPQKKVSGE